MTAEGTFPKSNGDIWYAGDVNLLSYRITSGTITLNTSSTSYDVDYADINIAAGQLASTDLINIDVFGYEADPAKVMNFRLDVKNVTSTGSMWDNAITPAAAAYFTLNVKVGQRFDVNDVLVGSHLAIAGSSPTSNPSSVDTDDANVMTTAFTLRLNFKYDATATQTSSIRYIATAIKG